MKKAVLTFAVASALSAQVMAQDPSPTCDELVWSAQVLQANPDIALSCQGVYERAGKLYARVEIELTRARGNRLSFRPMHKDGSKGAARSVVVPNSWRAEIDGRSYRASELLAGQQLTVYMPEDRFALTIDDGEFDGDEEMLAIEEASMVTAMPKTASPLFAMLGAGVAALAAGAAFTRRRLRLYRS